MRIIYKKNIPYLEWQSLAYGRESPSSLVPCLKSTVFTPLALPSVAPTSHQLTIYLHTDNINMPTTPVVHTK